MTTDRTALAEGDRVYKEGGYGGPGEVVRVVEYDGVVTYAVAHRIEGGHGRFVHVYPGKFLRRHEPVLAEPAPALAEQIERQLTGKIAATLSVRLAIAEWGHVIDAVRCAPRHSPPTPPPALPPNIARARDACRALSNNIDEFGEITDGEFVDAVEGALAALSPEEPAPALSVEEARREVVRLIREDFDPTPPNWSGTEWNDNADDVSDKIIALLSPRASSEPELAGEIEHVRGLTGQERGDLAEALYLSGAPVAPKPPASTDGGSYPWPEIGNEDLDTLMRVQGAHSVEDMEALERIVLARIERAVLTERKSLSRTIAEKDAENAKLRAAYGCHIQADAYWGTFPDNEEDAAQLRKSATRWRLTAREVVAEGSELHDACAEAAKGIPSVKAEIVAAIRRARSALASGATHGK